MAEFNLQIGIDAAGSQRGANQIRGALNSIEKNTRGADKGIKRIDKSARTLGNTMRTLKRIAATTFAAFAGFRAGRQFIQLSDQFTQIRNRMRLVTTTGDELNVVQAELVRQSKQSFISLSAQAQVFQRVSKGAGEFGFTQIDALKATDALAKAVRLSGVDAASANSALVQLGQGIAAGALRGQELNSVLEQTPRVADALADALGVAVGQLKAMGEAGEITVDKIIPGLIAQLAKLDAETKKLTPTFDEITTNIQTDFLTNIGAFNEATGAVEGFGKGLRDLAEDAVPFLFDQLAVLATTFLTVADQSAVTGSFILTVFNGISEGAQGANQQVGFLARAVQNLKTPFTSAFTAAQLIIIDVVKAVRTIGQEIAAFFLALEIGAKTASASVKEFFGGDTTGLRDEIAFLQVEFNKTPEIMAAIADEALVAKTQVLGIGEAGKDNLTQLQEQLQIQRDALNISKEELELRLAGIRAGGRTGAVQDAALSAKAIADAKALAKEITKLNEAFNAEIAYANRLKEIAVLADAGADAVAVLNARVAAKDAFDEATGALGKYNDQLQRAKDIAESVLTPVETMNKELAELKDLFNKDLISDEVFRRASEQIRATAGETKFLKDVATAAAEDIQGAFRDLFLEGTDSLSDFADQFGETLQRIAANFLANEAIKFLLGGDFAQGGTGDQFGGVLGSLAGLFTGGQQQAADTTPQMDTRGESIAAEAGLALVESMTNGGIAAGEEIQAGIAAGGEGLTGVFTNLFTQIAGLFSGGGTGGAGGAGAGGGGQGGNIWGALIVAGLSALDHGGEIGQNQQAIVGERGPELVGGPASVIGRQQTAAMMTPPEINLGVVNVNDPKEALDALSTNAGDKTVMNSIRRNSATIKRELGLA